MNPKQNNLNPKGQPRTNSPAPTSNATKHMYVLYDIKNQANIK